MPGLARVTWRAAGCAANLARGRNNWPNDCKTKDAGAGRVEAVREAAEEVEEVVAGGSSIKAFDPCLDTGEVGEGPVVEPFVETLEAEKIRGT